MTRLTEKQIIILKNAASRSDGSLLPLPQTMQLNGGALASVLHSLKNRGLAIARNDGDWTLTDAGRSIVAGDVTPDMAASAKKTSPVAAASFVNSPGNSCDSQMPTFRPGTRQALLLELLRREEGADTDEMMEVTGWQPHSIRALLSGFRKRGVEVTRTKEGNGVSVYRAALPAHTGNAAE